MARAVITRDEGDAAPYAAALAALGLDVVALPVTRVTMLAERAAALGEAVRARWDAVFVSSHRAAEALAEAATAAHAELPPIFAVGARAAAPLAAAGFAPHTVGASHALALAEALLAHLGPRATGARILAPGAEWRVTKPLEVMRAAGATVDDLVVYRSAPLPVDPAALAGVDILVVFAPSHVAALGELARLPRHLVAIGATTAEALAAQGLACAVAATPTPEGVAEAVRAVYPART